jgi:uncharacterized protein (DUF488 family)
MENSHIYTIGHGRRPIDDFLALLVSNKIEVLADVRAMPRSRWPQFNQKALITRLGEAGIRYVHFKELGGKIIAPKEDFDRGIEELAHLSTAERVCMMCSESLPEKCHRTLMLERPLLERGLSIIHIYPDGELKTVNPAK